MNIETAQDVEALNEVKLRERCGQRDGLDLVNYVIKKVFSGRIALVSSFGAHSAILLDMVSRIDRRTPVIFLDTEKLFPETLGYQRSMVKMLRFQNVTVSKPASGDIDGRDRAGDLWHSDPDNCCYIRKVLPLKKVLRGFDAWITGRKRYQGGLRSSLETIEVVDGVVKVNPLAHWSREMVEEYFLERNLPYHPLYRQGFMSLGCMPCTRPASGDEGERDGRWSGSKKIECGIHGGDIRKSDF